MQIIDRGAEVAAKVGVGRSPKWAAVARKFSRGKANCSCCGKEYGAKTAGMQVHHKFPFHDCVLAGRLDLELDDRNLIVLCQNEKGVGTEQCHLYVGHLGDFDSYNPHIESDVKRWKGKTMVSIMADPRWKKKIKNRPKSYSKMTLRQQAAFRAKLDKVMPPRTK
jgi:hypothetical protein